MAKNKAGSIIKIARRVIVVILIGFVVFFAVSNRDLINKDNFRRLLAKLDFSFSASNHNNEYIELPSGVKSRFAMYKGGLAVLSGENIKVYDSAGIEFSSNKVVYSNGQIKSSEKYIIIYDISSTEIQVYNTFALLSKISLPGKIITANVNDSGYITALCSLDGYKSCMLVYDNNFNQIFKLQSGEGYIYDAVLSPNNKNVAVCYINSKDGDMGVSLSVFDLSSDKPVSKSQEMADIVPIELCFTSNRDICLIAENKILYFNEKLEKSFQFLYNSNQMFAYKICRNNYKAVAVASCKNSADSTVYVVDADSNAVGSFEIEGKVKSVDFADGCAYALTNDNIYKCNISDKSVTAVKVNKSARFVFAKDKSTVLLIDTDSAKYIEIK